MKNTLTPRQEEVLGLYREGFHLHDIACILGLKHSTVYIHLKRVYLKTGVRSLADLNVCQLQPKETKEVLASYKWWSQDGIYCHQSNQNCEGCSVSLYGIDKHKGCYQPQANQLLLEKGIKPKLDTPDRMLTPREYEVLEKLSQGLNAYQISQVFRVTKSVIQTHMVNMRKKLNFKDTEALINFGKNLYKLGGKELLCAQH